MSSAAPAAARRPWIVSPAWDLTYVVLTPALIVPVVAGVVSAWLTPEQLYLAVISFASLGHHLPGFMRAYGDRELFARYWRRFVFAPPLAFGLALLFTPPPVLARALGISWTHLHGLELILLMWGTWHGLMQTYGFMRIYDLRSGTHSRTAARLDHALCLAIFVAGVVFSDTRMFSVAAALWQSGLPLFGPGALAAVRWVVGLAAGAVAAGYAFHLARSRQRRESVNAIKLLLVGTTGWLWWYCGRLSTNLLVGVAMFEIFHAVQYDAIVWIYNRRLLARAGERFGPLGFLFRDRLTMSGVYLGAIAAYSALRFFTASPDDRMFSGQAAGGAQWLVAWFVASSLLHFYFDGFIWKVSEPATQANLVDGPASAVARERQTAARWHAGKCGALAALAAGLILAERATHGPASPGRQAAESAALAELTPSVPDALALGSQQALAERRYADAERLLRQLIAERPGQWTHHCDLGEALAGLGLTDAAAAEFRRAAELAPTASEPRARLGELLLGARKLSEAITVLAEAATLDPQAGSVQRLLGRAYLEAGDADAALGPLRRAAALAPEDFSAQLQLGDAWMALDKPRAALDPYRRAAGLRPADAAARVCVAAALGRLQQWDAAERELRSGLAAAPESADLAFTLGVVLQRQGKAAEAQQWLDRAARHGLKLPAAGSPTP